MPRRQDPTGSTATDRGTLQPDWRLLAVVLVCVVALLGLAAIGPPLSGPGSGPGEQNSTDGQQMDTGGQGQQGGTDGTPSGGGGQSGDGQATTGAGSETGGGGGSGTTGESGTTGSGGTGGGGQGDAATRSGPNGALESGGGLRGSMEIGSLTPGGDVRAGAGGIGTGGGEGESGTGGGGEGSGTGGEGGTGTAEGSLEDVGELAFVVEADGPAYWRLGSYGRFEDGRWNRHAADGSFSTRPERRAEFSQRIRLYADHRTLPAAWRAVDTGTGSGIEIASVDATLRANATMQAGRSYTVESARPTTDPTVLRNATASTDDPTSNAVEGIYATRLGDTSRRVDRFTADLIEGEETRYDRVRTIEQWLRTEKTYDRSASVDGPDPVVDQIVFEMDGVNGEHAATAMVGMLRSQGIPARYVTGYATGYEVDDRYFVTEQQAHAWVEVYFPGQGWVPFDPTSPRERRQVEGALVLAEDSGLREDLGNYSETVDASRAEIVADVEGAVVRSADPNGSAGGSPVWVERSEEDADAVDVSEETPEGYAVQLNQSEPLPGTTLAIRVLEDGEPAEGVRVSVDGEYVGTTGEDGIVTTTVPWVEGIRIAIEPPPKGTQARIDGPPAESSWAVRGGTGPAGGGLVAAGTLGAGRPADLVAPQDDRERNDSDEGGVEVSTYSDIQIRLAGPPAEGARVRITATLAGRPVPDAAVSVDDEVQTRTADDGTATVELPASTGNATIRVRRGEVVDERTVRVQPITVETVAGLTAPGANATVALSVGNRSLASHDVGLAGDAVGTTDRRGRIDLRVPETTGDVPLTVRDDGFAATTSMPVEPMEVAVEDRFPLPGRAATVTVEHRGEPVDGATVAVDGEQVGTATNGSITVELPVDGDAQITARHAGVSAETEVDGLYRNAAILGVVALFGILVVLFVAVRLYRRYANTVRDEAADRAGTLRARLRAAFERLADRARRLPDRLVDLAVRAGRLLRRGGHWLRGGADGLVAHCRALARRVVAGIRGAAGRGVGVLLLLPGLLKALTVRLLRALDPRRILARIRALIARWRSSPDRSGDRLTAGGRGTAPSAAPDATGDAELPVIDLRDAWRAFIRAVRPPRLQTKTPGEIRRYAVERGMPSTPVDTVVETYRAAEYGGRAPSRGRLRRVVEAVREIAGENALVGRLPGESGDDASTRASDRGNESSTGGGD